MKKLIAAVVLSLSMFAVAFGQTKYPDLTNYEVVAKVGDTAILLDVKDARAEGSVVTFSVLAAGVVNAPDGPALDFGNHVFLTFRADCDSRKYAIVKKEGRADNQPFIEDLKDAKMIAAEPDTGASRIIGEVCKVKVGLSAE